MTNCPKRELFRWPLIRQEVRLRDGAAHSTLARISPLRSVEYVEELHPNGQLVAFTPAGEELRELDVRVVGPVREERVAAQVSLIPHSRQEDPLVVVALGKISVGLIYDWLICFPDASRLALSALTPKIDGFLRGGKFGDSLLITFWPGLAKGN
ncbi:MAG: hypothetical protein EHM61_00455 [Acidobacteria bacterium]|nr:MAG: hypothetical protein EHM61_00455 [Acidobacteriota bacterium]